MIEKYKQQYKGFVRNEKEFNFSKKVTINQIKLFWWFIVSECQSSLQKHVTNLQECHPWIARTNLETVICITFVSGKILCIVIPQLPH